jgi:ArsR family transcriptional regulator
MPVPLYQAKAEFFRTLGHPVRIRVLELLAEGDKPVHELRAAVDVEPASLSQQLSVLRLAGLVSKRHENREVIYSLSLPAVEQLLASAREILRTRAGGPGGLVDEFAHRGAGR